MWLTLPVSGNLQLGYYSTAPYTNTAAGNGTFIMQGGTFTVNGNVTLGESHSGSTSQNTKGYLYVTGGQINLNNVTNNSSTGGGEVGVLGGVLNVGNSGGNGSIQRRYRSNIAVLRRDDPEPDHGHDHQRRIRQQRRQRRTQ